MLCTIPYLSRSYHMLCLCAMVIKRSIWSEMKRLRQVISIFELESLMQFAAILTPPKASFVFCLMRFWILFTLCHFYSPLCCYEISLCTNAGYAPPTDMRYNALALLKASHAIWLDCLHIHGLSTSWPKLNGQSTNKIDNFHTIHTLHQYNPPDMDEMQLVVDMGRILVIWRAVCLPMWSNVNSKC